MCMSRSTTTKQVLPDEFVFSLSTSASSGIARYMLKLQGPSQLSSTCDSGILAQLQNSKQNLELDHVPSIWKSGSTLRTGESPLNSLDRTDSEDKRRQAAELEERRHAPLFSSGPFLGDRRAAHRSPAEPRMPSSIRSVERQEKMKHESDETD